jgi:glycosyltransferase involved in cell wall biosynthesis
MVGKSFKTLDMNHRELYSFKIFMENFSTNPLIHIIDQFIETEDLVGLYNLATFTLFPSFYEGFGFPILESQACGTPVITSNLSSMEEISGNSTFLVNPASVESIVEAILRVKEDRELRKDLIDKGLLNVKKYSWEKTAQETVNVYEKVINRK